MVRNTVTLLYILHNIDHALKTILLIFLFTSTCPIKYTLVKGDRTGHLALLLSIIIPALTMVPGSQ